MCMNLPVAPETLPMRMLRSEGMLDGGCQLLGLYGVPALVP